MTCDADLSPERKLCGGKGCGIATYRELMKNLSTKTSPDSGALTSVIAKWLASLQNEIASSGIAMDSPEFAAKLNAKVYSAVSELEGQIGGFDFASVITSYRQAFADGDDQKMSACLRWLRGEFTTKTEAKSALGVSTIIDDENWYDYLKLFALFARKLGYRGLIVFIDECVNLFKITNRVSRENNYEKILSMFNDTLQGRAEGMEIILGGTPQFLEDTRRGLFSYEALRSRLTDGRFASSGLKNMLGPVIRLRRLSYDELYALIIRLTKLHAQQWNWDPGVTSGQITEFLNLCMARVGADSLITPREIIRDYLSLLNILMQNREADFSTLLSGETVTLRHDDASGGETAGPEADDAPANDAPANDAPANDAPTEAEKAAKTVELDDLQI